MNSYFVDELEFIHSEETDGVISKTIDSVKKLEAGDIIYRKKISVGRVCIFTVLGSYQDPITKPKSIRNFVTVTEGSIKAKDVPKSVLNKSESFKKSVKQEIKNLKR